MTSIIASTVSAVTSASPTATHRASPQGGIVEGANPSKYDPKNPLILFIIQAGIIIVFCRVLHYPLSKFRQPRVIAEVIGGIVLGPSVMMRIPGFKEAIFPDESMSNLNLVANIGLVLYMFLVGLEVNMAMFVSNWRVALSVSVAGMILPFGLGCGIAYGIFHEFRSDPGTVPITFGTYMLFIGTALSITAFPVLCRILTELKLLGTPVGVTVLAAGVGNDVIGWVLLALCVALVNNGSGIAALYVLLCCVAWVLFLVFAVRPALRWVLKRSGSLENGPTQAMVALTISLALASAWFTGVIGVHAIFGAFLVGLICPHEGGFTIKLTEKIEDLVSVFFLPLYFALSGLSTNIGLLDAGKTWAYVFGVIAVAFTGKIVGGTLAARACKLVWRESLTIGVLMSCKGLVELIVLNIGLQAKILSTRTFTIFVVMALVTTVSTTPLTLSLYPLWYQKKLEAWKRGEIDWDGNRLMAEGDTTSEGSLDKHRNTQVRRLLVHLRLDSLPSLFTFISLLGGDKSVVATKTHRSKAQLSSVPEDGDSEVPSLAPKRPLEVHGVRILELTERTSSVMKVSEADEYAYRDPVVNAFRTFAQLNNVAVTGNVSIVPTSSFAETLSTQASDHPSDLVLLPWSETGATSEVDGQKESLSSNGQDVFIQETLKTTTCNTAVFFNRGFGGPTVHEARPLNRAVSGLSLRSNRGSPITPVVDRSHHIYFPFFGGADDRVALRFVLQLAQNSNVTVTIVHFTMPVLPKTPEVTQEPLSSSSRRSSSQGGPTVVDPEDLSANSAQDIALLHTLRDSLPTDQINRVVFVEVPTTTPIADCLHFAQQEVGQSPKNAGDLIVVGRGRHQRMADFEQHGNAGSELRETLGVVAEAIISSRVKGSVLVMHAAGRGLEF
ncbi:uncharacterized protein BP5553_01756 [Venustampulla echinocandica]|uniref:Cation/H+ exchanger transmembrane domain-containing protein n=1 Tax=Venustampulla echinocandica TaxID=2656787 RepID=A0A370U1X4_9HELO|nr:uncharacterized protein BP5553_01756 [Venustampulla echinocandica]RDL41777.1 hypothetical protein BP5553_01756 [Venustampulla echinocandica]